MYCRRIREPGPPEDTADLGVPAERHEQRRRRDGDRPEAEPCRDREREQKLQDFARALKERNVPPEEIERRVRDLDEALRQYRLTAMPIQVLCRPDCAGLCPRCGTDLNRGPHECPEESVDERWAELGRLKQDEGS